MDGKYSRSSPPAKSVFATENNNRYKIMLIAFVFTLLLLFRESVSFIHSCSLLRSCNFRAAAHKQWMMQAEIKHTSLSVQDISRSLNFYTRCLGMKVLSNENNKLIKLGFQSTISNSLEIVQKDQSSIVLGDSFLGIGVETTDSTNIFQTATSAGGSIAIPIQDYKYGASIIPDEDELKQFPVRYGKILDPDGYAIEVSEAVKTSPELLPAIRKIMLNVLDPDESAKFYTDIMGMALLRRRSNVNNVPKSASISTYVGYGPEETSAFLELKYIYSTERLESCSGFKEVLVSVSPELFAKILKNIADNKTPHEIASDKKSIFVTDPNNHKINVISTL